MICYEIVNPSDMCTFLAPDREIALGVLALVGEGFYGGRALARDGKNILDDERAKLDIPLFLSGITTPYEDWWRREGWSEEPLERVLKTREPALVAALRTVQYGDLEDRRTYDSALAAIDDDAKRAAFKRDWEDRRRSSMNRIVQRAWRIADGIEKMRPPDA